MNRTADLYTELENARRANRLARQERRLGRISQGQLDEAYARLDAAAKAIEAHARDVRLQLERHHIRTGTAHAYTPRETGSYGGGDHLTLTSSLNAGRLQRQPGDAFCKPAATFSYLDPINDGRQPTCRTCLERAERLARRLARQLAGGN